MNATMMQKLLAMPRNRWLILPKGLSRSLNTAMRQTGSRTSLVHKLDTPDGPMRVLIMHGLRVADEGGTASAYALCDLRHSPRNPTWDHIGRVTVDRATRMLKVEQPRDASPMAAWVSDTERADLLATIGELQARCESLQGTVGELKAECAELVAADARAAELEGQVPDVAVALDLLRWAAREIKRVPAVQARVVGSVVGSAITALKG